MTSGGTPALVYLAWARLGDLPPGDDWLTPSERAVLSGLKFPKRAGDWRLGRWVAKEAVRRALGPPAPPAADVEILASTSGAPVATVRSGRADDTGTVSLSHSEAVGLAAATRESVRLGCDVEAVAPRTMEFLSDYLTDAERAWVLAAPDETDRRAIVVWSAKEAALKALGEGLRLDTWAVEVTVEERPVSDAVPWSPLSVSVPSGNAFPGWWCLRLGMVWSVVAEGGVDLGGSTVPFP